MTQPPKSLWSHHAAQYARIGPPLTPSPADVAALEAAVAAWSARSGRGPRALLLGVTPAIARLRWPDGSRLIAVDRSEEMIRAVWPAERPLPSWAARGEWLSLPLADASVDMAFCDGGFTLLGFPAGHEALARSLRRVLAQGGIAAVRCFVRPNPEESADRVFADLWAGKIRNFQAAKWRLAMAAQADVTTGVRLDDVYALWQKAVPDPAALARRTGWSLETIASIGAYRGMQSRHSFPSLDELSMVFSRSFDVRFVFPSGYELSDRSPTFVLEAR